MRTAYRAAFLAALVLVCLAPEAWAHKFGPALFELKETTEGQFAARWKEPAVRARGTSLRPVLPAGCAGVGMPEVKRDPTNLYAGAVAEWTVSCPGGLVGKTLGVEGLDTSQTSALLRIAFADGRLVRRVLTPTEPAFTIPEREGTVELAISYGELGVEHIVTGWDHLTFVLGLTLLVVGRRRLLVTITAFTLGHSVTLALAVLGLVQVPQELTEAVIALSIVVLATELARRAMGGEPGILSRKPGVMASLFGLFHGLGFAGALSEIGLPQGEIPLALFSFNVGIELGQLGFIAVVLFAWALLRRIPLNLLGLQPVRLVPAYAIGTVAAFWFIQRTIAVAQSWGGGGGV